MVCSSETLTLIHGGVAIGVQNHGCSVGELRYAYRDVLNVGPEARPYLGGNLVDDDYVPSARSHVEFAANWGRKGNGRPNVSVVELGPQTLAALDRLTNAVEIASRFKAPLNDHAGGTHPAAAPGIHAILQQIAAAAEQIARSLNPTPPEIVKSRYVAKRLECSVKWVGDLVRNGDIPKGCIVPGSGDGKQWRFYRSKLDQWIESKS